MTRPREVNKRAVVVPASCGCTAQAPSPGCTLLVGRRGPPLYETLYVYIVLLL